MKANPGGVIGAQDIVGHQHLIGRVWETLGQQSIILAAERRMGKSCLIKKMRAEDPGGHLVFTADVEGLQTPIDFAERVLRDVYPHLSGLQRAKSRVNTLWKKLAGTEIAGVVKIPPALAPEWRALLEATIADLVGHNDRAVVFFWDELPLMLQNIKRNSGEQAAMAVLDVLRALRQSHGGLRMVYTGSIGLHHVLSALREAGHTNDATNDMRTIELPPLLEDDAHFLAAELIRGESLRCEDIPAATEALARETDCIPFYIHHVVAALRDRGTLANADLAQQIAREFLVHPQDPWHFGHYRQRIEEYYGKGRTPVVLCLLDELAVSTTASFEVLFRQLGAHLRNGDGDLARGILNGDREEVRRLLELLQGDHYIARQPEDGAYCFRFSLIQRWWRLHRSLS